jgi:hypothetical protein
MVTSRSAFHLRPGWRHVDQAWGGVASLRLQIGCRGNPAEEEQVDTKRTNMQPQIHQQYAELSCGRCFFILRFQTSMLNTSNNKTDIENVLSTSYSHDQSILISFPPDTLSSKFPYRHLYEFFSPHTELHAHSIATSLIYYITSHNLCKTRRRHSVRGDFVKYSASCELRIQLLLLPAFRLLVCTPQIFRMKYSSLPGVVLMRNDVGLRTHSALLCPSALTETMRELSDCFTNTQ